MGDELRQVQAPSQIFLRGRMVDFPLAPWNLMKTLGWTVLAKGSLDLLRSRWGGPKDLKSFEDLVRFRYGHTVAELFLLNYSQKLWGAPCSQLSPSVSGRRLKGLDFRTFLVEILQGARRRTRHLDGTFFYPGQGYGRITQRMADTIGREHLLTGRSITSIRHRENRIEELEVNHRETLPVTDQTVVSSLPVNLLLELLDPPVPESILQQSRQLRFRNLILVALFLDQASVTPNASIYFPEDPFPFTRVVEPRNRSPHMAPSGRTSLVVEMSCQAGDDLWRASDETLTANVLTALKPTGWIREGALLGSEIRRLTEAYPVLEINQEPLLESLTTYLNQFDNLHLTGRNALFAYTHLHDQMKAGQDLVQRLG